MQSGIGALAMSALCRHVTPAYKLLYCHKNFGKYQAVSSACCCWDAWC